MPAGLENRFCARPFTDFETTPNGDVYICCPAWLPVPIGNLYSGEDVWNSETAQELRRSMLDGSFRYCDAKTCNLIGNGTLPLRPATLDPDYTEIMRRGPLRLTLSHDRSCNLACPSCRKDFIIARKDEQERLDDVLQTLKPLLTEAQSLNVTGSGDPLGSNHFYRLLKMIGKGEYPNLQVDLQTNGLLLNSKTWHDLALEGRVNNILVSIDAATPETYAIVRRGGDFRRLLNNLRFVAQLRIEKRIRFFGILFVVQALNFREMPAFAAMGNDLGCDQVSFSLIRNWGTYTSSEFREHLIADPRHPSFSEFVETLRHPALAQRSISLGNLSELRDASDLPQPSPPAG